MVTMNDNKILVKIAVDYGAEEYIWISNFNTIDDLLDWYKSIEYIDYCGENILNEIKKELISINNNEELQDFYYENNHYPTIMLENNYSSFLLYLNHKYFHKGYQQA